VHDTRSGGTAPLLARSRGLRRLQRGDVRCLQALGAALGLVAHLLAFGERLETVAANFGEVREQIVAAFIGRDEAKAFAVVEPLDSTGIHIRSPENRRADAPRMDAGK